MMVHSLFPALKAVSFSLVLGVANSHSTIYLAERRKDPLAIIIMSTFVVALVKERLK